MSEIRKLESIGELDELLAESGERDVLILKHSLICPVSTAAWQEFERFAGEHPADRELALALIEIQHARPVSAAAAERTGVRHESPQALLVRGGQVVWHASHWQITRDSLVDALAG